MQHFFLAKLFGNWSYLWCKDTPKESVWLNTLISVSYEVGFEKCYAIPLILNLLTVKLLSFCSYFRTLIH